jgi:hypothetical protein
MDQILANTTYSKFSCLRSLSPLRRLLYFVVVVRPTWSDDPDSNAGCSIATAMVFHVREVEGNGPDKKRYLDPEVWELGC